MKKLKITFPERCIGCELCVLEAQRQLGKIGLEGAPIRIFKTKGDNTVLGEIKFTIDMDSQIQELKIDKIKQICPTSVFTIEEIEEGQKEKEALLE